MASWKDYLESHRPHYIDELMEFLRIPSISSLPDHAGDVKRAGEWVAARLERAGAEGVRVLSTAGHPAVYGEWLHAPGKPTVMLYGHFDVQPVDPLDLWLQPPFEPVIKQDRVYARGASDDKGNMLIPILAVEAMLQSKTALPVNVKFFFEGQEEIGSPQMPDLIASQKELLSCDLALSADGGQFEENQPALLLGLRGLCALQIEVQGARQDVHSGSYGGAFLNPVHALAKIIDSMKSPDGRILIEGFYDAVRPLNDVEKAQIAEIPYDENTYKAEIGVEDLYGEPGYSTYERVWARPALDVNGIWGGFQGEGIKTVIPSKACAKISCRLVPDQDPDTIVNCVKTHVERYSPKGVSVTVRQISSKAEPYLIPFDHPGNQAARNVLKALYGKDPYYARLGGSIATCSLIKNHLDAYTVNFAFGLKDEHIHAPNEFFRLSSFEFGQKAYCMLLEELGRLEME